MVDRAARNQLAELLRSLASGSISNDEFEDSIPITEDAAIHDIFLNGGWGLYSDNKEYKLRGKHALDKLVKKRRCKMGFVLKK